MNRSWRKLCPQFLTDFQDIKEAPEKVTKEVAQGRQLSLEIGETNVDELNVSHLKESLFNRRLHWTSAIQCTTARH
jgi:hypothetical protein